MKKRLLNGSMQLCQTWQWNCKQKLHHSPPYADTSHLSLWYCDHFHPILGKCCSYYQPNVKRNLDSAIKVSSDVIEAVSEWKESLMARLVKQSWRNFQLGITFPSDQFSISNLFNEKLYCIDFERNCIKDTWMENGLSYWNSVLETLRFPVI